MPLTSFVGRAREVAEVEHLLPTTRMLTLTGAGGCGKTRLALEVASRRCAAYADGVALVELAALTDPALVPSAVSAALTVRERPGEPALRTLANALHDRCLLLMLDNCEHLVDACAELAESLLRSCPHLRILATSRARLRISGEVSWRVPSLATPRTAALPSLDELACYESVCLFVERARATQPSFTLTTHNAAAVAEICCRLDGIPLALELAAARLNVLTAEQIAARLGDRFRLLTSGSRTALPRHQTLRALVDWSYALLGKPERTLFNRLTVFAGGFSLEAAEAVAEGPGLRAVSTPDVLDLLTRLVDQSRVVAHTEGAEVRYDFLETVRAYGIEKLAASGELDQMRERHAAWFLALTEKAELALRGPEQTTWLERLSQEIENLRAALAWYRTHDPARGLRLATNLARFWAVRGLFSEGRAWLEEFLARDLEPTGARGRALYVLGDLLLRQGDLDAAAARLTECLVLARDAGDAVIGGFAQATLGFVELTRGRFDLADAQLGGILTQARVAHDARGIGFGASLLAFLRRVQGEVGQAQELLDEALVALRSDGDRQMLGMSLWQQGNLDLNRGNDRAAEEHLTESVIHARALGDQDGVGCGLLDLARLAWRRQNVDRTLALLSESLVALRENQSPIFASRCLSLQGTLVAQSGARGQGIQVIAAASRLNPHFRNLLDPGERTELHATLADGRSVLGPARFARVWADGEVLTFDQAIRRATEAIGELRSRTSTPVSPSGGARLSLLSDREREVVGLIARGFSNRQIAAELVISEATAATHVKHILNKLDFRTRAQIAAWSASQGLPLGAISGLDPISPR